MLQLWVHPQRESLFVWVGSGHDLGDEVFVLDVAFQILSQVRALDYVVHLGVRQSVTKRCQHVSQFSRGDESLPLSVECLEGLHEVSVGSGVLDLPDSLVDGKELLQFVVLLSELLHSSILHDGGESWVQTQTVEHVSGLGSVDSTVTSVPEIEKVKDLSDLFDLILAQFCGSL